MCWSSYPSDLDHWKLILSKDAIARFGFEAIALKAAKTLGYDNFRTWLDILRLHSFELSCFGAAGNAFAGSSRWNGPDGKEIVAYWATLEHVARASVAMCRRLEAEAQQVHVNGTLTFNGETSNVSNLPKTEKPEAAHEGKNLPRRRRGPKPDLESPPKIQSIVLKTAGQDLWKTRLEDICEALDDEQVPISAKWRREGVRSWTTAEPTLAKKKIEYALDMAKRQEKVSSK